MQSYRQIALRARQVHQRSSSSFIKAHNTAFLRQYSDESTTTMPPRGPVLTESSSQRQDVVGAGIQRPQIEGRRGGMAPQLLVFLGCLMATPAIIYYYWQYRDQHMREKKEGMLKEIQARAARTA